MRLPLLTFMLAWAFLASSQPLLAADGPWITDFEKAKAQAEKESKMVLLDFTGSDWCPPCKALHRNVFSKSEFLDYARKNLVLVEIDFPRRKPQSAELRAANRALAKQFSIKGYPTVIITDAKGKVLSREVGYQGDDASSFVAKAKKLEKK